MKATWAWMAAPLAALLVAATGPAVQAAGGLDASKQWVAENVPGLPAGLVEAACKDGKLMLYHLVFRGKLADLIASFTKTFPCIKIDTYMASGGPLQTRFTSEWRAGQAGADVWMNSSPPFADKISKEGLLLNWTPPNDALVPAHWKRSGYWYGIGLATLGFAWNTKEVTPAEQKWLESVKTWDQIAKAPFKGRSCMVHVRAGGSAQLPYYYLLTTYGIQSWKDLKENLEPSIFSGAGPLADRLAAGECVYAPHVTADTAVATRWLQKAPIRWTFPEPGLAISYLMGISSKAAHPDAAKLFVAWSLSPHGQSAWVNSTGLAPMSKQATDRRKYAKESWYRLPGDYYPTDWDKMEKALKGMNTQFKDVFGQ
ncbi:MAG: extracellular solute-binding protein [Candidatus Lambdaproteobacteria bacterium]|nr:extracellular solute-binding protein [Candidatus Lambdaproteobacteria bacterium]